MEKNTIYAEASVAVVTESTGLRRIVVLDGGQTFEFTGDYPNLPRVPGRYNVSIGLPQEATTKAPARPARLWSAFPVEGRFPVVFLGFLSDRDDKVRIFERTFARRDGSGEGKSFSLAAKIRCVSGDYAGLERAFFLSVSPADLEGSNRGVGIRSLATSILGPLWKTGPSPLTGGSWEDFQTLLMGKQRPGLMVEVSKGYIQSFWMGEMAPVPDQPPPPEEEEEIPF